MVSGRYAFKSVSVAGYRTCSSLSDRIPGQATTRRSPYMEAAIDYIVKAIKLLQQNDIGTLDVRRIAGPLSLEIQRRLRRTTWNSGCSSWYLTEDGYNGTMYPGFATQFMKNFPAWILVIM